MTKITENSRLSVGLRNAAAQGLQDLKAGSLTPIAMLQHSDLWLGNFLIPRGNTRRDNSYGFIIIDWAGSSLSGHPFFDLLRFSMSIGVSSVRLRSEISEHCKILGCRLTDAMSYTVAALGVIGINLEHFREDRYLEMCERVFETISASIVS